MASLYAIVTGGNQGMGLSTTIALAAQGYHVTFSARSAEKGDEALGKILEAVPGAKVDYLTMDLANFGTIQTFAEQYLATERSIALLVCNAGIMNTPLSYTIDGFESQLQTNHLGHAKLLHLLMPKIKHVDASKHARVVCLSSRAHMRIAEAIDYSVTVQSNANAENEATYDGWRSYGRSKLCNILFAKV